ncbi:MAG: alpha/beta fold hydrolase [Synechocystis sp.]
MKLISLNCYSRHRPTLLYLPGMDGTGQLFYRQQVGLSEHFNLLALGLGAVTLPRDWTAIAKQINLLLSQKKQDKALYLCGESFGGCLALAYASQFPSQITKLILINPATAFGRRPWLQLGIPLNRWLPELFQSVTTLTGLPFLAAIERLHPGDRRQLLNAMRSLPPAIVAERLALLQSFSESDIDLSQIEKPSLIVASQRDRLLPSVEEAYRLQSKLTEAAVHILPHSGHACLLETELSLRAILAEKNWLPQSELITA